MNRLLKAFIAFTFSVALAGILQAATSVERYVSPTGTQIFNLDDSGNMTVGGTSTVVGSATITGAATVTGATTFTGASTHVGAVTQSTTTFSGAYVPYLQTLAQINVLLPGTTGQWVGCSDCTRTAVCVSSGSNAASSTGAWVVPIATGTFVGSTWSGLPHCQ